MKLIMEKGIIHKIFNYYFNKDRFGDEIFAALREFFNKPNLKVGDKLEVRKEDDEGMFNEWFIFDFKLSNGKTPLEDFYEKNPYNLDMVRLQAYKDLQDNQFGFYKVNEIRLGEGLTLENLQTGEVYQVREYSATFGLKEEQVFSARVGKVGDHYELVGTNPSFAPVKFNTALENLFRKDKKELNPKILRDSSSSNKTPKDIMLDFPSLEEAEIDFKKVLAKYNLDQFVTITTIKGWIYNHSGNESFNFEANILWSLLHHNMKNYDNALTEVLNSFNVFYNFCPQKELGGKSPFEKKKEHDEKGIVPDIIMSLSKFSVSDWGKKYSKALQCMKQAQFKKAIKKFDEVFVYLLKHKITYSEIYRLYANKGVCHLALDEPAKGEFMLKISTELNSFYNFARQQLKECKKNYFKTKKDQDITRDIGYQYYQFLKPLKINFAHIPKDHASVINIKIK